MNKNYNYHVSNNTNENNNANSSYDIQMPRCSTQSICLYTEALITFMRDTAPQVLYILGSFFILRGT